MRIRLISDSSSQDLLPDRIEFADMLIIDKCDEV